MRLSFGYDGFIIPGPLIFFALCLLTVQIFYLRTLHKTLTAVDPSNRRMEPKMIWLMLIPLFNLVWHFVIVDRIALSIQKQLSEADQALLKKPARTLGMVTSALFCTTWLPVIGGYIILAALVCGIIYWVRIAEFRLKLQLLPIRYENDTQIFGIRTM